MKYMYIANVLEERIRRGDYITRRLPVENELVSEFGVSRVTVRKSLQMLIDHGVLTRLPNAGVRIADGGKKQKKTFCFLKVAYPCISIQIYLSMLERIAAEYDATIRPVDFVHWNDPAIREALNTFDGIFFIPLSEKMPDPIRKQCAEAHCGVVVFDHDLTDCGIPSIFAFPPKHMSRMLDYLFSLGHRKIVGLNTQPEEPLILQRFEQWLLWQKTRNLTLRLINQPVESYEHSWIRAYEVMSHQLKTGAFDGTALLCTTQAVAIGAIRAFHEYGIQVGKDVSVCAINDDGISRYLCPSLTCFQLPENLIGYLRLCVEWMLRDKQKWDGPLKFQADGDNLFIGESTNILQTATDKTKP